MKINRKISAYNNSSRYGTSIQYIVIHWVGAVSKAQDNARYFAGGNRYASAHYFVDDSSIWQSVNDSRSAWHCGGGLQGYSGHKYYKICGNSNSIGIEMCCKRVNGKLTVTEKTQKQTAELVQYLMRKHGIPASKVIRHYDVTGKDCPHPFIDSVKWNRLHALLTNYKTIVKKPKLAVPNKTLIHGDFGTQVQNLQMCLNKILGTKLITDGSFGSLTEKAVKQFQRKYGLTPDGYCGPKTRAKMKSVLKKIK